MNRRSFVKFFVSALAVYPILNTVWSGIAWAAKKIALPEGKTEASQDETVVQVLGYKSDIKDIDYTKFPQRKKPDAKKQFCDNCSNYKKLNDGWGMCTLISSGAVAAKGWCASWAKQA